MLTVVEATVGNNTRRLLELALSLAVLGLGIQFTLAPEGIFGVGTPLELLTYFMRHQLWAILFLSLGGFRTAFVLVNGFWPQGPTVRFWLSVASLLLWFFFVTGYWLSLPSSAGYPALIFSPMTLLVEGTCMYALSALRASKRGSGF